MKNETKVAVLAVLYLCTASIPLLAQRSAAAQYTIDWQQSRFTITAEANIPASSYNQPAARFRASRELENQMRDFLTVGLKNLVIDAEHTVAEIPNSESILLEHIDTVFTDRVQEYSRISQDMQSVQLRWHFPLYPSLAEVLVPHDTVMPVPRRMGWAPRADYTGLIIFAGHTDARGALLPVIRAEDGTNVYEYVLVDPEIVHSRGLLQYAESEFDTRVTQQVGAFPLRVTAIREDGTYNSDIILRNEDMRTIFRTHSVRQALKNGNVIVILSSDNMQEHY